MAKVKTKKNIEKMTNDYHNPEADFWAFLTIASFPLAMLVASSYGATPFGSFLYGAYGSLAILVANYVTCGKLWMFVAHWQRRFDHPEFSYRLAIISGTILLLLETALIVFLFTDASMDRALLSIIVDRRCYLPDPSLVDFCQVAGQLMQR